MTCAKYMSTVTNQNRLTKFFLFFLFDKFKGNTLLHNELKILFLACRYTPHFDNCQNRPSLTESLFNGTKQLVKNPNSATTTKSNTNIKNIVNYTLKSFNINNMDLRMM